MPSFKLTWEARLSKDATEENPNGEHIGVYDGFVTFDNLLLAQKASTVAGEQMFQKIIEHSMQSQGASEATPVMTDEEKADAFIDDVEAALVDKPEPPVRMVPRRVATKKYNKKGA